MTQYKLIGSQLLKRKGREYIQVAMVPYSIKTLAAAVAWWESMQEVES